MRLADHYVGSRKRRYYVPARETTIEAQTDHAAIRAVVQLAHGELGIPPYRRLIRESLGHACARPALDPPDR